MELRSLRPPPSVLFCVSVYSHLFFPQFLSLFLLFSEEGIAACSPLYSFVTIFLIKKKSVTNPLPFCQWRVWSRCTRLFMGRLKPSPLFRVLWDSRMESDWLTFSGHHTQPRLCCKPKDLLFRNELWYYLKLGRQYAGDPSNLYLCLFFLIMRLFGR